MREARCAPNPIVYRKKGGAGVISGRNIVRNSFNKIGSLPFSRDRTSWRSPLFDCCDTTLRIVIMGWDDGVRNTRRESTGHKTEIQPVIA